VGWGGGGVDERVANTHKPLAVAKGATTICIDQRPTDHEHDPMTYSKKACNSIAEEVTDGKAPERRASDDGDGGWLPPKEVGLFKGPEQIHGERGAAPGGSRGVDGGRQVGPRRGARCEENAVVTAALMEGLGAERFEGYTLCI
jgi:hypothetical protein